MTQPNLYVDVHVLQTVPSSNINRDDTGAPKTAQYGGVTRARVSSQAWKHAMREDFADLPQEMQGSRTKDAAALLTAAIQARTGEMSQEDAQALADSVFTAAGVKLDKNRQTGALLLISRGQIAKLADYALSHDTLDKKELKAVLKGDQSLDLALFGRMVADNPELNVEASAQVAHALSTHEIVPEFDYFTAMDDEQPEDNAGAAMLGTVEFNSATLYRYANLNFRELAENLGTTDATEGALDFLKAFLLSMPTGKQNTFANKTLPSYVMVTLREDTPVNLVSAFETPITTRTGYVAKSVDALEKAYTAAEAFVAAPLATLVLATTDTTVGDRVANVDALLARVADVLKRETPDEDANA
ncbi:type I-E CRISPR-associated protein Cas7/Cse4/CasC [Lacticaseibacillus kribbianus]|uniref:type I-E CRISPR-associated protein Cas7/Cse4/CasC n=1 Tax=Lacticaseibacillus kribbianus TaxID=2926292 RepID=UPI001CD35548|nr:type I-E CRISPR-associated protein Cas7/Cse4/CasC [Lacticaseibacillus kribbianus]